MPTNIDNDTLALLQLYNGGWLPEDETNNPIGNGRNNDINSAALTILGNGGHDRITGDDTLLVQLINGGAGSDQIFGMGGQDNINGGVGNDLIEGGSGGGAGLLREVLNGGDGIDTLSYENSQDGVTINLMPGAGGNIAEASGGDAEFDLVKVGFENVIGSNGDDVITGDNGNNVLIGLGGLDKLNGGDGDDRIIGNEGPDRMDGGNGNDTYIYWSPNDLSFGGHSSHEFIDATLGQDKIDLSEMIPGEFQIQYGGLPSSPSTISLFKVSPDSFLITFFFTRDPIVVLHDPAIEYIDIIL